MTFSQQKGVALLVVVILILAALVGVKDYRGSNGIKICVSKMDSIQSIPTPKVKDTFLIDINVISDKILPTHPLVTDTLSAKILRSRVRYGGFVNMEQMCILLHRDSLSLRAIERYIKFDTKALVRYQVNVDNAKLLAEHPYISKLFAKNIVEYREKNGAIKDFEELKNIKYFPKSKEKYLKYYIKFD
ncbi:MAG: helix-hairpin-helix domain-containing protein [Flavobacteriales bacterium]|nr:helix-hairpin-helix domain-containing protein [Flavobacteriales bacterium]